MRLFLFLFFCLAGLQLTFADELVKFTGKGRGTCDETDNLLLASAEVHLEEKIADWQIKNPDTLLQSPRIDKNVGTYIMYGVCWSKHAWIEATYVIERD